MLSVVPTFLVASVAVLIRDDMGFTEAQLGLCVAAFYGSTAIAAVHAGRLAERLGGLRASTIGVVGSATAMLGIAALARAWWHIVAFLLLAGAVNAVTQSATSLALARAVAPDRQGVAFGLKQTDGSLATLLAGVAAAVIAVTLGWRWALVSVALASAAVFFAVRPARWRRDPPLPEGVTADGDAASAGLLLVALGGALAWAAGAALGGFYVESAVAGGLSVSAAGWWLVGGSAIGTVARIGWGGLVDHRSVGAFRLAALLLLAGAAGFAVLGANAGSLGLATGTVLAFGAGWAYPGLLVFGVVRRHPATPARASSIVLAGTSCGGVIGPPVFGLLAERLGYAVAWRTAAVALVLGALSLLGGDRAVRAA